MVARSPRNTTNLAPITRPAPVNDVAAPASLPARSETEEARATAPRANLPGHIIREISVKSRRHEKTVRRHLRGEPVRPIVAADIDAAMRALGLSERAAS